VTQVKRIKKFFHILYGVPEELEVQEKNSVKGLCLIAQFGLRYIWATFVGCHLEAHEK